MLWTTNSGGGTISNANQLDATYTIAASDIVQGSVTFTLTAQGNASCSPASDQIILSFTNSPTANAGSAPNICVGSSVAVIGATANNASSLLWQVETGSGAILPGTETTLNPIYQSVTNDGGTTVRLSLTLLAAETVQMQLIM